MALTSTSKRGRREQIQRVLRETKGNKAAAAKRLGVSRRPLCGR